MKKRIRINKQSVVPWFILSVAVFCLSTVVGFMVIPKSLAAEEVMVLTQGADGKIFGSLPQLDLFNDPRHGGQKIIDPLTKGSYSFLVENRSTNTLLDYEVYIESENEHDIPLVFNVKKNTDYVFGTANTKLRLGEKLTAQGAPDPELLPGNLDSQSYDIYVLEWEWEGGRDPVNDDRDTNQFGNPAVNEELNYTITIRASGIAEFYENMPTPTPGTQGPRYTPPPTTVAQADPPQTIDFPEGNVPLEPLDPIEGLDPVIPPAEYIPQPVEEVPEIEIPESSIPGRSPITGDDANLIIWISLALAALAFLIPVIFFKRKKKKE